MPLISYIFSIAAAVLVLAVVLTLLLKKRLRERHALWWLIIGVLALIAAIFPRVLENTAQMLGILLPISLVFFVGIIVLFIASVQHSAELTDLEEKARTLAEQHALLEKRLRDLEHAPFYKDEDDAGASSDDCDQ
ncbi:MAG: DUF2304 domain-containing protein [Aeromicrobium sp.]|nr:MAG: DUF2304 domain-containing protein [Aeromicrobium sp.]